MSAPKPDYVLVIDDDQDICDLIELALGDEGHEVASRTNPADALGLVAERPPGLILLDTRMPAVDGETFVRAYRAMPNATAPIVIFSATPNVEEHAARLGAVGWITKPFDLDDLISTVDRALRLRATSASLAVRSPSPTRPLRLSASPTSDQATGREPEECTRLMENFPAEPNPKVSRCARLTASVRRQR